MVKLCAFTILLLALVSLSTACHHRDYGNGATVCVCSQRLPCTGDFGHVRFNSSHGVVDSFTTAKAGARFLQRAYHFVADQANETSAAHFSITINRTVRYQKILGFGGAFTDSMGVNLVALPAELQERLIRDYFANDGAEYRVARVPIGGTDYSTRGYSLDDHPDDDDLSHFALQVEDLKYKIPFIHMAANVSSHSLKIFGSPWSPPAWMKTNKALVHGGELIGQPGGKYYRLFAYYFIKFIEAYQAAKVPIWGITVENEPHMGYDPRFMSWVANSLGLNATQSRDFIKLDLGPALHRAGLANVSVMILDDNIDDIVGDMYDYVQPILTDAEAAKYVAGIGFHWYNNQPADKGDRRAVLSKVGKQFPDKFLLSTEACEQGFGKASFGNWATFDRYAEDIIKVLNRNAAGWVDWNMVLDLAGGPSWVGNAVNAPVIVNATAGEYLKQPIFFAMAHFSKLIVPGSVRVAHMVVQQQDGRPQNESSILVTIFERPDGSTVATILNKNDHEVTVRLTDGQRGHLDWKMMAKSLESLVWY